MRVHRPLRRLPQKDVCIFCLSRSLQAPSSGNRPFSNSIKQSEPNDIAPDKESPTSQSNPFFGGGFSKARQESRRPPSNASNGFGSFADRRKDTSKRSSIDSIANNERNILSSRQASAASRNDDFPPPQPRRNNGFQIRRQTVRDFDRQNHKDDRSRGDPAGWQHLRSRSSPQSMQSQGAQERPRHNDNQETTDRRSQEMFQRQKSSVGLRYVDLGKNARHTAGRRPDTRSKDGDKDGWWTPRASEPGQSPRDTAQQSFDRPKPNNVSTSSSQSTSRATAAPSEPQAPVESARDRRQRLLRQQAEQYSAPEEVDEGPSFADVSRQQMKASRGRARKGDEDEGGRDDIEFDFDEFTRQKKLKKNKQRKGDAPPATSTPIELPDFISVQNLATALKVRSEDFVAKLEELGFEDIAMDHVLNAENAGLVAMEYNYEPISARPDSDDLVARPSPEDKSSLPQRPPVVTIMGHVDHGKTTILDYMRKSSVAASEHGGITQHIGAFSVRMADDKTVTFLDTPGHAAFLSMRQRGANVTDIIILVVAADDSVKPQTIEAIKHARAAKVPIIVAMNKVDKDEANVEKVKQDLMRHEIEVEDLGGDVQAIPVSGKTGQGIDSLIEAMESEAEVLELRAETDGPAEGWVLEAEVKASGRVATVLVRRGTIRPGDIIVAGKTWARVRSLRNEAGEMVRSAGPGTPVEIDGWRDQPVAGDEVLEAPSEERAIRAIEYRAERSAKLQSAIDMEAINESRRVDSERRDREKAAAEAAKEDALNSQDGIKPHIAAEEAIKALRRSSSTVSSDSKELYFVVRADVSGSAEAVAAAISNIPLKDTAVSTSVLRIAVGHVSESDVALIGVVPKGQGFLVNFNQPLPQHIAQAAEENHVKVIDDNIIYRVTDSVRGAIEDHLPPIITKRVLGDVEISQVFSFKVGKKSIKVAGCKVRNGMISRGKKVRVYRGTVGRESDLVYDGTLGSLRNQKKDVQEMRKGTECGLGFEDWEAFEAGDVVQCYEEHHEKRRLAA